jgi:fatty acid desaturase
LYFLPLYSFLYVSWRTQSIQWAWAHRDYETLIFTILPSYIWLACLPLSVSIGSILIGGLLVALVVTLSHESEDILFDRETCFTANQFQCTRDIVCPDPITEYLFGGMQYQLEHHLFPFMPRYKNHTVRRIACCVCIRIYIYIYMCVCVSIFIAFVLVSSIPLLCEFLTSACNLTFQ